MEAFCKANPEGAMDYLKSFRYIVADEYHYLLTDATINKYIDFSYVTLNELTKYRPVIFMSATAHPFFHRWRYETNEVLPHVGSRTSFDDRLSACVCELCGKTNVPLEIHHVNKVKNLKGKQLWELAMIAKKRKTLAVCKDCHHKIHHP